MLGTQEAIHQTQAKERREEHRARRCNLVVNCVRSSKRSREINGRIVVLKDSKLYIDTGTTDSDEPFGYPFAGYYLPYPDSKYEGLVSTISSVAPILNWIYVDTNTYEVKYGVRDEVQPHLTGPFDCTRQDRRLTLEGWEGFVVVEEQPALWALYFDRDDNGLKGKVSRGTKKLEVALTRSERKMGKEEAQQPQRIGVDEEKNENAQEQQDASAGAEPVVGEGSTAHEMEDSARSEQERFRSKDESNALSEERTLPQSLSDAEIPELQIGAMEPPSASREYQSPSPEHPVGTPSSPTITEPWGGTSVWSVQEQPAESQLAAPVDSFTPASSVHWDDGSHMAADMALTEQGTSLRTTYINYLKPYIEDDTAAGTDAEFPDTTLVEQSPPPQTTPEPHVGDDSAVIPGSASADTASAEQRTSPQTVAEPHVREEPAVGADTGSAIIETPLAKQSTPPQTETKPHVGDDSTVVADTASADMALVDEGTPPPTSLQPHVEDEPVVADMAPANTDTQVAKPSTPPPEPQGEDNEPTVAAVAPAGTTPVEQSSPPPTKPLEPFVEDETPMVAARESTGTALVDHGTPPHSTPRPEPHLEEDTRASRDATSASVLQIPAPITAPLEWYGRYDTAAARDTAFASLKDAKQSTPPLTASESHRENNEATVADAAFSANKTLEHKSTPSRTAYRKPSVDDDASTAADTASVSTAYGKQSAEGSFDEAKDGLAISGDAFEGL